MHDIFISFSNHDLKDAKNIVRWLEKYGWSVFFSHRDILGGQDWRKVIEKEAKQAGCIVVLWSNDAMESDYVSSEIEIGREPLKLVPLRLEEVALPFGFGHIHKIDYYDKGKFKYQQLKNAIEKLVGLPTKIDSSQIQNPILSKPINGVQTPEMWIIHSGSFRMGDLSGIGADEEKPAHVVTFTEPFALARYVVTYEEYIRYTSENNQTKPEKAREGSENLPVVNVSWDDAQLYVHWLSTKTGCIFRLPSEAEWEYAARAGTATDYWWGSDFDYTIANCYNESGLMSGRDIRTVYHYKIPNKWGLFGMLDNVSEWVQDCYNENYYGAPNDGSAWEISNDTSRVFRGGNYYSSQKNCRCSSRDNLFPNEHRKWLGFRLACTIDENFNLLLK